MSNKVVDYTAPDGRKYKVLIPENSPPSAASRGVILGPTKRLEDLGLPEEVLVKLHNELFARNLISYSDVANNMRDVVSAIQHTFTVDAQLIAEIYYKNEGGK